MRGREKRWQRVLDAVEADPMTREIVADALSEAAMRVSQARPGSASRLTYGSGTRRGAGVLRKMAKEVRSA